MGRVTLFAARRRISLIHAFPSAQAVCLERGQRVTVVGGGFGLWLGGKGFYLSEGGEREVVKQGRMHVG